MHCVCNIKTLHACVEVLLYVVCLINLEYQETMSTLL
jgi:hypothetical protein